MEQTGLIKYDEMCRAIVACQRVDEVKKIRDQAKALEVYARQGQNEEAEDRAREIRLRAQRRAGELLLKIPRDKGGPSKSNSGPRRTQLKQALQENKISEKQGREWQRDAKIPDEEFEEKATAPKKKKKKKKKKEGLAKANGTDGPVDDQATWLSFRIEEMALIDQSAETLWAGMTKSTQKRIRKNIEVTINLLRRLQRISK